MNIPLKTILDWIEDEVQVQGDLETLVTGFASVDNASDGDLVFVSDSKKEAFLENSSASVFIVSNEDEVSLDESKCLVVVDNPSRAFSQICSHVESLLFGETKSEIHPSALMDASASLGAQVSIGPNVVVGAGTVIKSGCRIAAGVVIGKQVQISENVDIGSNVVIDSYTEIGSNCRIAPGVVIGASGFGYDFDKAKGIHQAVPQIGRVKIGDSVDVGPNTTIDRARVGETVIGTGTKIDNQVQIAHNVKVGKHCIICAQVGISGSVQIGDYCVLGGKAGVSDHIRIADGVQLGGGRAVIGNLDTPGAKIWGFPATDYGLALKVSVLQRKLPDLFKRVSALEK